MARRARQPFAWRRRLDARDVSGLEPLGTLGHIELHGFALIQAPVSRLLDGREMDEHVLPGRALNETVSLGSVEPLDCAFFSHNKLLSHVFLRYPCFAEVPSATLRGTDERRLHVAG